MTFDPDNPLAPIAGETPRANGALNDYVNLGDGRTLDQLAQSYRSRPKTGPERPPTRQLSTLKVWSATYHWQARLARHLELLRAAARAEQQRLWAERALAERERTWALAQQLQERAEQMLAFPLTTERTEDEGKVTIVTPARWSVRDAALIAEVASKLARLAAELETERVALQGYTPKDLKGMSVEELLALKAQLEKQQNR